MLTCRDLVELVTDYLEGALPAARDREVRQHLGRCSGCLHYLAQIQLTARLLAASPSDPWRPDSAEEGPRTWRG